MKSVVQGNFCKTPVEERSGFLAILGIPADRLSGSGERPGAILPANRSQWVTILSRYVSRWALWHLLEVAVLVPPLCDSTWQVAVPMTNNLKVQHGQRSSPHFLAFWGHRNLRRRRVQL